jgi:hypothetical protein
VNDNGVIVGDDGRAVMSPNKDAPFMVLNDFLPKRNSPFAGLATAYAVSESDEIVGSGSPDLSTVRFPFLAVPK